MMCDRNCDPLALTTAINTLSVAIAEHLGDDDLVMLAAVLTQIGDTLATIAVQRQICREQQKAYTQNAKCSVSRI